MQLFDITVTDRGFILMVCEVTVFDAVLQGQQEAFQKGLMLVSNWNMGAYLMSLSPVWSPHFV